MMAYVTAEDDTAAIELVVFPTFAAAVRRVSDRRTARCCLPVRIDAREEEAPKVLLNEAQPLTESAAVDALHDSRKSRHAEVVSTPTRRRRKAGAAQAVYLRISQPAG